MGDLRLADEFILETHGLTKEFAGFFAVSDVNLRIRRGSIHALIGPNGAGKTTCFNLLTKFLVPTSGQILYDGRDITREAPAPIARRGVVRSFQISAVFAHLSVLENVRVALQRKLGTSFQFWRSEHSLDVLNAEALELLRAVDLEQYSALPAVELSYGRKRALEIATTLAMAPTLMLLGRNGAGRTSTLRAILGLIGRRLGSIKVHGAETTGMATHRIARMGVGYCPEERGIFSSLSAEENLLLPPPLGEGGMSVEQIY